MSQKNRTHQQAVQRGKTRSSATTRRGLAVWGVLVLALVLVAVGLGWWLLNGTTMGRNGMEQTQAAPIGGVMGCRGLPRFSERLGYTDRPGISTSERTLPGLVMFDARLPLDADLTQRDLHQEPSWNAAGTLGPFVLDRQGHIYTAPVPRTAVSDNPPGTQNTIYRVDSDSARLAAYVTLPDAPPTSEQNPFGILGLTYDCDHDVLYVSSVAGSTLVEERGRIVQVDLASGASSAEVLGVDAMGLGVFRGVHGKRLYFGLARESALASVALDDQGHAVGEIRNELELGDVAPGLGEPKVRRVSFDQDTMTLYIVPFSFNLRAVSEQQQVVVQYRYDAQHDGWEPL